MLFRSLVFPVTPHLQFAGEYTYTVPSLALPYNSILWVFADTTHQYAGLSARVGLEQFKLHVPLDFEVAYRRTFETFEAQVDGRACRRIFMLTWANAPQFGAGAKVAPAARMDDGLLDCVVFEETSRVATVLAVPALFAGFAARVPGVQVTACASSVVESPTPLRGHVDGEPFGVGRRADALAHPGVLRVVAR